MITVGGAGPPSAAVIAYKDQTMSATIADLRTYRWSALRIDGPLLHRFATRHNWDDGVDLLRQCIRHPACSLATALLVYWRGQPRYFCQYTRRSAVPEHERPQYDLLKAIEGRVARGTYRVLAGTTFDPRRGGLAARDAEVDAVRALPACMLVAATSRGIVPFAPAAAKAPAEPVAQPTRRKKTAERRTVRGWRIALEVDYDWANDENGQVDHVPRPRGLARLCTSLGPFPGLLERFETLRSPKRWNGMFSVRARRDGTVFLREHASDFGFPELRALTAALRALSFEPAKRANRPVPFLCLLSVTLQPASRR